MPLYYFHLCDGVDVLLDPEGKYLEGQAEIESTALAAARSLISHDALGGHIGLQHHIDVEDEAGKVVHCLDFNDAVKITGLKLPRDNN